jgi:hypothetical protein
MVEAALRARPPGTPSGSPPISATRWGVYAFYDFEDEPIYVGQTNESLRVRIRRHLTNQRTDAVGMRVLDPYEIMSIEMWPLVDFSSARGGLTQEEKRHHLNRLERTVYERAIRASKFGVILNEKIPPEVPLLADNELPPAYRFPVVPDDVLDERRHADNRIARRAETLGRLANVIRERGSVSNGLRRVVVVQAVRLAWLGSVRLAEAEGRPVPDFEVTVNLPALVAGALGPDEDEDEAEAD